MAAYGDEQLVAELIDRFGGPHAVLEQISRALRANAGVVGEDSGVLPGPDDEGYCYLRLFDAVEYGDACQLGPCPTVADVRRFSNRRAAPFGNRNVVVAIRRHFGGRLAHIEFNGGDKGIRPVSALAALAKDLRIGALPDGVSTEFPPSWIPARRVAYQTWDYIPGSGRRNLDVLSWLGNDPVPDKGSKSYEGVNSEYTRLMWSVKASPVGPSTAKFDLVDGSGAVKTMRTWDSYVAPYAYYQNWFVRGERLFVQVEIWRPAKVTTTPGAPMPTPPIDRGGHGELSTAKIVGYRHVSTRQGYCYVDAIVPHLRCEARKLGPSPRAEDLLSWISRQSMGGRQVVTDGWHLVKVGHSLHHVEKGNGDVMSFLQSLNDIDSGDHVGASVPRATLAGIQGYCYLDAVSPRFKFDAESLGAYPRVEDLVEWVNRRSGTGHSVFQDGWSLRRVGKYLYHMEEGKGSAEDLVRNLSGVEHDAHVGATQAEVVKVGPIDNVADSAKLALKPRGGHTRMVVPFAARLDMDKPQLLWDLSNGKRLSTLLSYFESVELVSLRIKATVHKGDGDTLLSVAVDTVQSPFKEEMEWVAASHTLHVSGNRNGATSGEVSIEGNHGFGTQLRGVALGNATPVVQAFLETSVVAVAYLKCTLVLNVTGTGVPTAIVLPARSAVGGGKALQDDSDSDDDDVGPSEANIGRKR